MKTEITAKDYKDIYEACGWDSKSFSIVLKKFGYSDELIVDGNLDSINSPIKSLVNVKEVNGYLDLSWTPLEDLGKLKEVRGELNLENTPIEDLGALQKVGGWVYMGHTPLSKKYSEKEIREMVDVKGIVFL